MLTNNYICNLYVLYVYILDQSHKNYRYFKIDDITGRITYNSEERLFGAKPVHVIATDRGVPSNNNTEPYQVNVYFLSPNEHINKTLALSKFATEEEKAWLGGWLSLMHIIAAIGAIVLIALIILVVVIIK